MEGAVTLRWHRNREGYWHHTLYINFADHMTDCIGTQNSSSKTMKEHTVIRNTPIQLQCFQLLVPLANIANRFRLQISKL